MHPPDEIDGMPPMPMPWGKRHPIDYPFYANVYLQGMDPVIPKGAFLYYIREAQEFIDDMCRLDIDTIRELPPEYALAACDVAEHLCKADGKDVASMDGEGIPTGISSERVGEYSVSYSGNTALERAENERKMAAMAVKRRLGKTGLLFRGTSPRHRHGRCVHVYK